MKNFFTAWNFVNGVLFTSFVVRQGQSWWEYFACIVFASFSFGITLSRLGVGR